MNVKLKLLTLANVDCYASLLQNWLFSVWLRARLAARKETDAEFMMMLHLFTDSASSPALSKCIFVLEIPAAIQALVGHSSIIFGVNEYLDRLAFLGSIDSISTGVQ